MPLPGFATEVGSDEDVIYNHIIEDYTLVTNLERIEADKIYNGLKTEDLDEALVDEVEVIIYGKSINSTYEDTVLYIQDNYTDIIDGMTGEEKLSVDKYFLYYALQYYKDYGSPDDFKVAPVSDDAFRTLEEPILMDNKVFEEIFVDKNEVILEESTSTKSTKVASVRVFSDPTESLQYSSGFIIDTGRHAWITVSNISSSNITVGKFSIAPGKTMVLGTWGTPDEHVGLWYNLEGNFVQNNSAYDGRVSLRVDITSSSLSNLNAHIVGYDYWSVLINCSSFAVTSWNSVCSTQLSAGVINTPKNLANSIMGVSGYYTNYSVPQDYQVYYANGTGTPILSTEFN